MKNVQKLDHSSSLTHTIGIGFESYLKLALFFFYPVFFELKTNADNTYFCKSNSHGFLFADLGFKSFLKLLTSFIFCLIILKLKSNVSQIEKQIFMQQQLTSWTVFGGLGFEFYLKCLTSSLFCTHILKLKNNVEKTKK